VRYVSTTSTLFYSVTRRASFQHRLWAEIEVSAAIPHGIGLALTPDYGAPARADRLETVMLRMGVREEIEPVASATERPVQVLTTTMRLQKLVIDRPAIVAYFQSISPDKQEIALVHALEVGVKELGARRGTKRS
jgi:hypothetical protein